MTTKAYKVNIKHFENAKKLKMTMAQYVDYLDSLVIHNRTNEQQLIVDRLDKSDSILQNVVNSLIGQRARELKLEKKQDAIADSQVLLMQQQKELVNIINLLVEKNNLLVAMIEGVN